MGDLKSKQQEELATVKEHSAVPTVLFHTRSPSSSSYSSGQDVVFKTILFNEGGGYDPTTGRFTVSVAGVYLFSAQVCTSGGKNAQFDVILDNKALQSSVHMDGQCVSCTTIIAFARVTAGAKAWIRCSVPSNIAEALLVC
ncbi:hypothetical protein DPMN_039919 [Dreissena polymorpha]|uniref:C1q domain-containing protein n=1 Tax=Dreissena polymorpha TaxID=45954 RepID=A0A9D4CWU7_DREPO|nr:hypothetical protein DPMN_039919 [Dreissena polymorpha]